MQFCLFVLELLKKFGRTIVEGFHRSRGDDRMRPMTVGEFTGTRERLAERRKRHVSGPMERRGANAKDGEPVGKATGVERVHL
jgi:hypothetical protein